MSSTLTQNLHAPNKPRLPTRWVEKIFRRLQAQQGGKMAALYKGAGLADLKDEWAVSLFGFHPEEIERGLNRASAFDWQMTLPAFKKLCRPCLDPEFAWYEAQACIKERDEGPAGTIGSWTHPAVFRAASTMSAELRTGETFTRFKARWTRTLEVELERGWCGGVPGVQHALPPKIDKPAPCPPHLAHRLAQMRQEILENIERRKARDTVPAPLEDPLP